MSHLVQLTDSQVASLMAGMITGVYLKNKTEPYVDEETILEPIPVGGWGCIGWAIDRIEFDPETTPDEGQLAVYSHDCDLEYSGFTHRITYDPARVRVDSLDLAECLEDERVYTEVDISTPGVIIVTALIGDGTPQVEPPAMFLEDSIFYFINYTLLDRNITESTPVEFKFDTGSFTDSSKTTMLTYAQAKIEGEQRWALFFITPIENIDGGLYSLVPDNISVITEDVMAAPAGGDGIYIHSIKANPLGIAGVNISYVYNMSIILNYDPMNLPAVYEIRFRLFLHGDTTAAAFTQWRDHPAMTVRGIYTFIEQLNYEDGTLLLDNYLRAVAEEEHREPDTYTLEGNEIFLDCRVVSLNGTPIINSGAPDINNNIAYIGAMVFRTVFNVAWAIEIEPFDVYYIDENGNYV